MRRHGGRTGPRLAPFVDEAERSRRVPKGAADALIASGLMPLVRPARHGGYEHGWMAYADVLAPIARQSGSLAWVLGFLLHHQWALGFFPQATQDEVYSQAADPCIASMFAPSGRAKAEGASCVSTANGPSPPASTIAIG
ncbi:acyl-CoA dehydrogenase family protein [Rhizorhabdus histidinilytica]